MTDVTGWMCKKEMGLLFNLAKNSESPIVEIGSFKGKSTITLANGPKAGTR